MKASQKRKEKKERKERLYRPRTAGEHAAHQRAILYGLITVFFCLALLLGALIAGFFIKDDGKKDEIVAPTATDTPEVHHAYTVIIDPGHGGPDTGDKLSDTLNESELTVALANEVAAILQDKGCRVVFTRTEETEELISDEKRIKNVEGDCMISLHTCVKKGAYYSLLSDTTESSGYLAEYFGTPKAESEHVITRPTSVPCVLLGIDEDTEAEPIAEGIMEYLERFVK